MTLRVRIILPLLLLLCCVVACLELFLFPGLAVRLDAERVMQLRAVVLAALLILTGGTLLLVEMLVVRRLKRLRDSVLIEPAARSASLLFGSERDEIEQLTADFEIVREMLDRQRTALRDQAEEKDRSKAQREWDYQAQGVISSILKASLEPVSMEGLLTYTLDLLLTIPEIGVESKGAIFVVPGGERRLNMAVQRGLSADLREACEEIPFGYCLCGRAASTATPLAVTEMDERHDVVVPSMTPHGHVCIPILFEGRVLGVINLYLHQGQELSPAVMELLRTVADTLAGMMERRRTLDDLSQAKAHLEARVGERTAELESTNQRLKGALAELQSQKFALDQHSIVAITDREGRISYANDRFVEISQYTREELIGSDHRIINSGYHPRAFFQELWETIARGEVWHGEVRNRRRDGSFYWVETTIVPFLDDAGTPYQYVAIRTDISERKVAELKLEAARDAALAVSRAKSDFLATMSHEIRTPMNGVIGMLDLLRQTELGGEQRRFVDTAFSSADTLMALLNGILDLSKIESGRLELEAVPFEPRRVLAEVCELAAGDAQGKGVELSYFVAPSVPVSAIGDPVRLRQIFSNLIGNAVKFTNSGEIEVLLEGERVEHPPGDQVEVRFSVKDSGIGIPQTAQTRIFGIFSQADSSTTRRYGGTGLGLAITRQLVELLGGRITLTSRPGEGSLFTCDFRLAAAAAEPESLPAVDLTDRRVLICAPSAALRRAVAGYVSAWGATVVERETLGDGETDFASGFDLLLLDAAVGGPSSPDLPPRLILDNWHTLGVVATDAAMRLGKPVREERLCRAVARLLRLAHHCGEEASEAPLAAGSGRILVVEDNPVNREVTAGMLHRLGYRTELAADGRMALTAVAGSSFDLILMDCQMPGMDGYAAARAMREAGISTPIVALTAHAAADERSRCIAAGMDDYLSKPVQLRGLAGLLQERLGGTPPSGGGGELEAVLDARTTGELREALDPETLQRLYRTFLGDAGGRIAAMREAAGRGDGATLGREAHALKGSSANVGALALGRSCREIERAVREARWGAAAAVAERMEAELRAVESAATELLAKGG